MLAQHLAAQTLRDMGVIGARPVLDSARRTPQSEADRIAILDSAGADFAASGLRMDVAAVVQGWATVTADDLAQDETLSDRLYMMLIGLVDEDVDGEMSDDEQAVLLLAMETAYDYMVDHGVTEADALALVNGDGDAALAERVQELLKGSLPAEEEDAIKDIDEFAFGGEASADLFDCVCDAVYRKTMAVRGGKKVRIKKRVSGHVRLSAGQKAALKKARRRAHNANAKLRRMKSMRVRARSGL